MRPAGDEDFLCWGRHAKLGQPLRINPLVLVESTYLFVELSKQTFRHVVPRPPHIEYVLELRGMTIGQVPVGLIPGPVGTLNWDFGQQIQRAPVPDGFFSVTWSGGEVNPGRVAAHLLSKLYEWFGLLHEDIPYTEQVDGVLVISRERILKGSTGP